MTKTDFYVLSEIEMKKKYREIKKNYQSVTT